MTRPRHERLSALFLAASELPEQQRSAYLDEACGDDEEMRAKVEAMLRHDTDVPEILKTGAVGYRAELHREEAPERIGPYRIIEQLGEGGMGVIYLAEQAEPVRRQVALKLVKLGLETRQVLARFETERQALAAMNHPNIAQVHDAGATAEGRPYFAMEYVDGEPITSYCDRARLSIRQRLELFIGVCDGVQHAHQKGVIHRDIKASNVLVAEIDGRPVPKIIDFGIAKATAQTIDDRTPMTQAGQIFGTPAYMSPEQASMNPADVDTRADVYGLGALLYELLVSAPPFEIRDLGPDEIRRKIREDDPHRPSTRIALLDTDIGEVAAARATDAAQLPRRLRGDLDWITLKALAKEREQRYASPSELAADIGRHLEDEPVLASPRGNLYYLGKFVRKHRTGVGFAAIIAVLLVGFGVALAREASRADRAALLATEEAQRAREELRHAQGVSAFLIQLFEAAAPDSAGGDCASVCDLVDGAIGDLAQLETGSFLDSRLMLVLGKMIQDQGAVAEGRQGLREALARMPKNEETMHFLEVSGWTTAILRRLDEAELMFERLAEIQQRSLGRHHPEALLSRAELGRVHTLQGRNERSEAVLAETLEQMRTRLGDDHPYTLQTIGYLSMLYWRQSRLEETGALLNPALDDMRRVFGSGHYVTLATLYNLARVEANHGDRKRSLSLLKEAVDSGFIYLGRDEQGRIVQGHVGMRADPHLTPLQGDPEFEAIVARAL